MAPRVYNLKGLRNAIFRQVDWSPSQTTEAKERVDEFIDRAYMRLCQDAPFLFFEDEIRWAVHPDREPGSDADLLRVAAIGANEDAWTLECELLVGATGALVWETDRKWDARYLLLKVPFADPDADEEWHLIRIREVFEVSAGQQGELRTRITLETPWRNVTDTGIEFKVVSDEFTLPDDIVELKNAALMEDNTGYPYPLEVIGQTQAEFATFPNNRKLQASGFPRVMYRREHQAPLKPPTYAPAGVATDALLAWTGPEPKGTFEYLITYVWGRQEIWSHSPGPDSQTQTLAVNDRYEPYYESGPSPVSAVIDGIAGTFAVKLTNLPNIDHDLGFNDIAVARYRRAGIKKRIYRRRVTSAKADQETPNVFYYLDEVDGHEAEYVDDGSITPDKNRPFREIHGYSTFRLYPRPERRFEMALRVVRRPTPLYDDTDVPKVHRDGIECILFRAMAYLYEAQGEASMADRALRQYTEALFALGKRYADLRPANRLRRRRPARVSVRRSWRRDRAGIVKNA